MFCTRITVNFGDTDPAGLVYFPNIFHYCHVAMERFFEEVCSIPYSKLVEEQRLGFPTVKIECEFRKPLRHGDVIDIQVVAAKLGNKSMTFAYRVLNNEAELCATIHQVVVAMDLTTHQSVVVPHEIRNHCIVERD